MTGRLSAPLWVLVMAAMMPQQSQGEGVSAQAPHQNRFPDQRITAVIERKLGREQDIASEELSIQTRDGYVSLEGEVASFDQAKRVIELAESTPGVNGVHVRFEAEN